MTDTTIAFPVVDGNLSSHFGHAERFVFMTVRGDNRELVSRKDLVPPPHAPGVLPVWLAEQGATVILAGGMGQRAIELLAAKGIQVELGVEPLPVAEICRRWRDGSLTATGASTCTHGPDHVCEGH